MNGILNVLKPSGMTSFDVVAWLRRLVKIKKIGHTGTLDPMACGVLPVCIGNATKIIEYLVDKDKLYRAEISLGIVTDTQDSYGKVISQTEPNVNDNDICETFAKFTGKIMQLPPMYSALKVDGKKLCELARQGITVDRVPREIEIYSIDVIDINRENGIKILFDVHCSKGTYIRTLCEDIGKRLGCGAHMSFLLRKRAGTFDSDNSLSIEEVEKLVADGEIESHLINADKALDKFNSIILDQQKLRKLINGLVVSIVPDGTFAGDIAESGSGLVKVYDETGSFIAIGELRKSSEGLTLKSRKLFV